MFSIRRSSTIVPPLDRVLRPRGEPGLSYLRKIGKAAFWQFSTACGNAILQSLQRGRVLVICYHSVLPDATPDPQKFGNVVSTSEFAAQLQVLSREFNPISAADLSASYRCGARLPSRPVLVTFDDGYRNNRIHAAPLLLEYGIPALVFVTTGYIGTNRLLWPYEVQERILCWSQLKLPLPGGHECELPQDSTARYEWAEYVREQCKTLSFEDACAYLELLRASEDMPGESRQSLTFMDWDEVRELTHMGFEIGSHTVEHAILSRLSKERLRDELERSKKTIERELSIPCPYFAYPNGRTADLTAESQEALRQAQYDFAFTSIPSFCSTAQNPLCLGRVVIPDHPSVDQFRAHVSTLHSAVKRWL
jgi:peptidoglycan/xylan/chitin deacetylase (PgdA/CDA1 family)